jgi:hypothetical protein
MGTGGNPHRRPAKPRPNNRDTSLFQKVDASSDLLLHLRFLLSLSTLGLLPSLLY